MAYGVARDATRERVDYFKLRITYLRTLSPLSLSVSLSLSYLYHPDTKTLLQALVLQVEGKRLPHGYC